MALEQYCPVLQIIGYQNSGKTTVAEAVIEKLTEKGLRVASVKHHGHGGKPDQSLSAKDSMRHTRAGAFAAGVEGADLLQLNITGNWPLSTIISFYQVLAPDLIVVEGYKKEAYPKVVLLRNDRDLPLLEKAENVVAVIVPEKRLLDALPGDYSVFLSTEKQRYLAFLQQIIRNSNTGENGNGRNHV